MSFDKLNSKWKTMPTTSNNEELMTIGFVKREGVHIPPFAIYHETSLLVSTATKEACRVWVVLLG